MELKKLKLSDIAESPFNPRKFYDKQKLAELAADIDSRGLDSPIKVRPTPKGKKPFEIVFGHRRYRAHELLEHEDILVTVQEMNDLEASAAQVVENDKREDLQPLEQAEAYRGMMERHKLTPDELAVQVGRSRTAVYDTLKLTELVKDGKKALQEGIFSKHHALAIARLPAAMQAKVLPVATREGYDGSRMSVVQLKRHIRDEYLFNLKDAPFNTEDAQLVPKAGACSACLRRSDSQPSLLEESGGLSLCLEKPCYEGKVAASSAALLEKMKAAGRTVLVDGEAATALSYSGPYVKLKDKCGADPKTRTWGQLLKDSDVEPAVVIDDEGNVVEVAKKVAVREAMVKKGLKAAAASYELGGRGVSSAKTPTASAQEKKRKAEVALRRKTAFAAIDLMAAAKATHDGADAFLRALVVGLLRVVWSDSLKVLAKQLVPSFENGNSAAVLLKYSAPLKGPELRGFVVRLAYAQTVEGGGSYQQGYQVELLDGAKLLGIEVKKVEADVRRRSAEEAKRKEQGKAAVGVLVEYSKELKAAKKLTPALKKKGMAIAGAIESGLKKTKAKAAKKPAAKPAKKKAA